MHRTKFSTAILLSAIFIALSVGCGSPGNSAIADAGAVRLEGWSAVNNLFQDGRMFFGGQPDEASFGRLASQEGVRTVINIRYPEEMDRVDFDEQATVESLGMKYISIPVSPETFSTDDVSRFAEVLSATDEPVLLHCASSNRVGGMWAAYLALHRGIEIDEAIDLGRAAGLRSESMVDATRRVARDR